MVGAVAAPAMGAAAAQAMGAAAAQALGAAEAQALDAAVAARGAVGTGLSLLPVASHRCAHP